MHDATKVVLGGTQSSAKDVSAHDSDPATFLAGLAVVISSTGALSLTKSAGRWAGISLGKSLSNHKKTAVVRDGESVPILLEAKPATGSVTITSYANLIAVGFDTVTVGATVFTAQAGAATPGTATFRAATDNTATAASLAAQINAHATAGALVVASSALGVVTIKAKGNTSAGNAIALAYADNGTATVGATVSGATLTGGGNTSDFVTVGAKVYISNTSGKADDAGSDATISDAIYISGVLSGIGEDGVEVACALVDMQGGL